MNWKPEIFVPRMRLKMLHVYIPMFLLGSDPVLAGNETSSPPALLPSGTIPGGPVEENRTPAVSPNPGNVSDAVVSDAEWYEEYRQLNELIRRYEEGVNLFRQDVETIIDERQRVEMERIQSAYDARYEKLDAELRVDREKAIAAFEEFVRKYPRSVQTPLAMFRLAELYYDEASYAYIVAQRTYDQLVKGIDPNSDVPLPEEPKYDFSRSLQLYERIYTEFAAFRNNDGVHYMRGYLLGNELAAQYNAESARDAWFDLIENYPNSVYASHSYLRIGEYYFELGTKQDLLKAIDYYKKVMSYRDKWYDRALYKVAWSYYKLSDYQNAIANFISLIDYSEEKLVQSGLESDLKSEAVEYLALSFADEKDSDVEKALAYFNRLGERSYKFDVLKRLADVYYKQAKFEQSIATYVKLQELYPTHVESPKFQHEIVLIYQRMPIPDIPKALSAKELLIKKYSPDSEWSDKQGLNRAAIAEAQTYVQTMLQELAIYYHSLAEKAESQDPRQSYYNLASDKYREFLTRFPYSENAYEMQYLFAESLYFSQKFEDAAVEFEKAMASTNPKYHADAADGRVDAYQELLKRREGDEGILKPFSEDEKRAATENAEVVQAAIPLSPLKQKYVQSIDVLARVAPQNPEIPNYMFIGAQIHRYHHQYDEAQKRFEELIALYPNTLVAIHAAANLVDGLIRQEKWVEVQEAVDRLVSLNLGTDGREWSKVRSDLIEVRVKAKQKEAETLADRGDLDEAYRKFVDAGTDVGLMNAAKIMDNRGKVDSAIETYQQLVTRYPKSEHVPSALFRIASNYEKFFELQKAIEYYQQLASTFPRHEQAPLCVNNAAVLYVGLHKYKDAAIAYERYSLTYPSLPDAELFLFLSGRMFGKASDSAESVRVYRDYMRRYERVHGDRYMEAFVGVIEGLEKLGRGREALDMEKRIPTVATSLKDVPTYSSLGQNLYARVMFKELERTYGAFEAVKLSGSVKTLAANLDRKNQLKDQIEGRMREIVNIGDLEWSTAGIYLTGLSYHSFAEALRDAVPPGLSPEDEELYRQELDNNFIFPFEDRALEYYKQNLEIESTRKVWNDWLEKTYVQLNRLRPDLYPARKKEHIQLDQRQQYFTAPFRNTPLGSDSTMATGS